VRVVFGGVQLSYPCLANCVQMWYQLLMSLTQVYLSDKSWLLSPN